MGEMGRTPRSAPGSSKDGGLYLAKSGKTAALKRDILAALTARGSVGVTVAEYLPPAKSVHHGQVSSAFSTLHQAGLVKRLAQQRGRYEVYVLPRYVNGRETKEHSSVKRQRREQSLLDTVAQMEDTIARFESGADGAHDLLASSKLLTDEVKEFLGKSA